MSDPSDALHLQVIPAYLICTLYSQSAYLQRHRQDLPGSTQIYQTHRARLCSATGAAPMTSRSTEMVTLELLVQEALSTLVDGVAVRRCTASLVPLVAVITTPAQWCPSPAAVSTSEPPPSPLLLPSEVGVRLSLRQLLRSCPACASSSATSSCSTSAVRARASSARGLKCSLRYGMSSLRIRLRRYLKERSKQREGGREPEWVEK